MLVSANNLIRIETLSIWLESKQYQVLTISIQYATQIGISRYLNPQYKMVKNFAPAHCDYWLGYSMEKVDRACKLEHWPKPNRQDSWLVLFKPAKDWAQKGLLPTHSNRIA